MLTTVLGIEPSHTLSAEEMKEHVVGVHESQRLDFKSLLPEKGKYADLADDICAFANAA